MMKADIPAPNGDHQGNFAAQPPAPRPTLRRLLNILLAVLIITAGIAGTAYINKTAPKARKRPPVHTAPLVQVQTVVPEAHRVAVPAMGTAIPAREIILKSRVSGEIVTVHPEFTEGGFLTAGAEILGIDPQDYKLALTQKQRAVADAEYALKLEQGHQDVAKREWQLLNGNKSAKARDIELALRKPHLAKARADLAAAKADLDQARLNLARTTIRAPFNAIVRTKNVDRGSQVSVQDQLAELVGTDEYWIQASVPVDRLEWIKIPLRPGEAGAPVRIMYRNGYERTGTVIKLLGDLETAGRMARILIEVTDPLGLQAPPRKQPPLLIGEYVQLEITGRQLENVFRIPRPALRDNTRIWIADEEGKLAIRRVETLWRDAETVVLREGLRAGDRLILSDLPTPVDGMPVNIEAASAAQPTPPSAAEKIQ
ncbi:MAG: efflux RND transporter periplasmic adaptor subunit [Desulfobacterales bacterium]|nr:MAG: efflux RND transporter periplasmic adaptor subunit [Desulfobacterales bacterium]